MIVVYSVSGTLVALCTISLIAVALPDPATEPAAPDSESPTHPETTGATEATTEPDSTEEATDTAAETTAGPVGWSGGGADQSAVFPVGSLVAA